MSVETKPKKLAVPLTKRLMTATEFAVYIGAPSVDAVYNMKTRGELPSTIYIKRKRSLWFDKIAADLWIEGMKTNHAA